MTTQEYIASQLLLAQLIAEDAEEEALRAQKLTAAKEAGLPQ